MGTSEEEPWNGEPSRRAGSGAPSGRGTLRRSAVAMRFPANKVKLVFRYTLYIRLPVSQNHSSLPIHAVCRILSIVEQSSFKNGRLTLCMGGMGCWRLS